MLAGQVTTNSVLALVIDSVRGVVVERRIFGAESDDANDRSSLGAYLTILYARERDATAVGSSPPLAPELVVSSTSTTNFDPAAVVGALQETAATPTALTPARGPVSATAHRVPHVLVLVVAAPDERMCVATIGPSRARAGGGGGGRTQAGSLTGCVHACWSGGAAAGHGRFAARARSWTSDVAEALRQWGLPTLAALPPSSLACAITNVAGSAVVERCAARRVRLFFYPCGAASTRQPLILPWQGRAGDALARAPQRLGSQGRCDGGGDAATAARARRSAALAAAVPRCALGRIRARARARLAHG